MVTPCRAGAGPRRGPTCCVPGPTGRSPDGRERGAGTVLVLGMLGLLLAVAVLAVLLAQATTVRHRAGAVADLAALAAARAGADNVPSPCRAARAVAEANDAAVHTCSVGSGGDARVSVTVTGTGLGRTRLRVTGSARAAPTR